jgi:hypothetical protein
MPTVDEHFTAPPGEGWRHSILPGSAIEATGYSWRFTNMDPQPGRYTNAQIDDYEGLARATLEWSRPVTLTVRARFSHNAGGCGTAGFGFWNDPFMMTAGTRLPALPRAIWFFYGSPDSTMKLDLDTPGHGWKAATVDAQRWPFYLLAPTAPLAVPLMNIRPLYRRLWPIGQRAIGVCEALIAAPMTDWHTYELRWAKDGARWSVDGQIVLECDRSPGGRLAVMWIDNRLGRHPGSRRLESCSTGSPAVDGSRCAAHRSTRLRLTHCLPPTHQRRLTARSGVRISTRQGIALRASTVSPTRCRSAQGRPARR